MNFSVINKSQLEGALRLDAEYYQPEYLNLISKIKSQKSKLWRDIEGKFITGPFGSEFNVENYVTNGKFRYIRGKDIKEFFLSDDDNVYIPETDYKRLSKYSLQDGDILISVVGTLGNTTIIDISALPAIFSCKSTAFRTKEINPYYFIAYLNSKYGKKLLERSMRGAVQTGLNIDDLKDLSIIIPSLDTQNKIGDIVLNAKSELENSKYFYSQAEDLLLEELGLKDFKEKNNLFNIVNLSDVRKARRMDAEYFQSEWEMIKKKIGKNVIKLGDLVNLQKGFEPGSEAYQEDGKLFIRVSSISKNGIIDKDQKYLSEELYQKLKKDFEPKVGEILLTKDATPGIAYVLKEKIEGIIAGGILRLKIKKNIDAEYISLCINSIVGQSQVKRDSGGSVIAHWKPEQIKNVLIPILPKPIQQKIADLVQKSHEARKKAKELLEQAKQKVEELIEK